MKENVRVVVLGKNHSTPLGVIRSLGVNGYTLDVFYVAKTENESHVLKGSKYVSKVMEIVGRYDEDIVNMLMKEYESATETLVLFPTDDYTSSLIDRNRDVLSTRFLMPYIVGNKQGAITHFMDKSVQSALAHQFDLPTAPEWLISLDGEIVIPEELPYPCFCKPYMSARGGKNELTKCENRKELENTLLKLQEKNPHRYILVQKFLNIKREYSISGVCNDREVYLPALLRKLRVARHNKGVTLQGIVENFDGIGEVKDKVIRLLQSVHYVGMIDIELIETDERIYFNELNFRSSGVHFATTLAGVNLPLKFIETITEQKSVMSEDDVLYGKTFVNDKVLWEDFRFNEMTYGEFKTIAGSDFSLLVRNAEDPKPGELFLETVKSISYKQHVKRVIKKMIGRK